MAKRSKKKQKRKDELRKRKYLSPGVQLGPTIEVEGHKVETFSYNYVQELKEYIDKSSLNSISKLIVSDNDFSGTQLRIDCDKEDVVGIISDISNIEHCFPKYIETIDDYFIVDMEFTRGRLISGYYNYLDRTLKLIEEPTFLTPTYPMESVTEDDANKEYFINHRGAKVYLDSSKHKLLDIDNSLKVYVLSVGENRIDHTPQVTIRQNDENICYNLPKDYIEWVRMCISMSISGTNVFPAEVIFSCIDGKYFADIL